MANRGRPKKTLDDLPSNWQERMLELASTGASDVEIRIDALGHISEDLWYRMIAEEPEFSLTVKKAHDLCEAWWVKAGRAGTVNKINLNTGSWIFNMKNRFNWRDKHDYEHSGPNGGPIQTITSNMTPQEAADAYADTLKGSGAS